MVRLFTFLSFAIISSSSIYADQGGIREVRSWGDGQWAVVDVETVTGTVIVLSDVVGREIDFEERNRFAVFEGETLYNRKQKLSVLKTPVTGFQSAVFLRLPDGKYGLKVTFRNEIGIQHRLLHIKNANALNNMRDYFANGDHASVDYPKETGEHVSFEVVKPKFQSPHRLMGQLVLESGEKLKGELLPVVEAGQMMIETEQGFRRVDVAAIQQVGIGGRGAVGIVQKTLQGGIYWGLTGGFTGLMSGVFYEGVTAKDQMLYGALIGGTVGGAMGLLDGLLSIQAGKTFHLGSLDRSSKKSLEISPTQIRLRF